MFIKINLTGIPFLALIVFVSCSGVKVNDAINGGFENNYDGVTPDGWSANSLPQIKKYADLSIDNSVAHTGDKSILISISNDHPSDKTIYNWIRRIDGLKDDEIYELQGWVKTKNIKNSPFIDVQCWNDTKIIGSASTTNGYSVTGTKDWQLIKTIFTIPKSTSKILIRIGIISSENNGGKVWFDDVQIRKIK